MDVSEGRRSVNVSGESWRRASGFLIRPRCGCDDIVGLHTNAAANGSHSRHCRPGSHCMAGTGAAILIASPNQQQCRLPQRGWPLADPDLASAYRILVPGEDGGFRVTVDRARTGNPAAETAACVDFRTGYGVEASSMASAKSRFSLLFSSSSNRNRLASETSIPPY
jgi:hypothetical protein